MRRHERKLPGSGGKWHPRLTSKNHFAVPVFRVDEGQEDFFQHTASFRILATQLLHGAQRDQSAVIDDPDPISHLFGDRRSVVG